MSVRPQRAAVAENAAERSSLQWSAEGAVKGAAPSIPRRRAGVNRRDIRRVRKR